MPKFIIQYNGVAEIIEAASLAHAEDAAQQAWMDSVDQDWVAEPYNAELAKELNLEDEA